MKIIITLLVLSFGSLSYGHEKICNIDNYQDYVKTKIKHYCDLSNLQWSNAEIMGWNLYGADLSNAQMSVSVVGFTIFVNANLQNIDFYGSVIGFSNMSGADLRGADLRDVRFTRVSFSKADLRGANVKGANFKEVDFHLAKVDPDLADYLESRGITSFIVVENEESN